MLQEEVKLLTSSKQEKGQKLNNLKGYVVKKEEFDGLVNSYKPLVAEIAKEVQNKYIKLEYEKITSRIETLKEEIAKQKDIQKKNSLKIKISNQKTKK